MPSGDIARVPTPSDDDAEERRRLEDNGHEDRRAAQGESLQESLGYAWRALSNLASTVAVKVNKEWVN